VIVYYGENNEWWYEPSLDDIDTVVRRELKELSKEDLIDLCIEMDEYNYFRNEYKQEIADYCMEHYKEDIYNG
jgi:hypothetical protein